MEVNPPMTPSRLKVKLGTSEMKLNTKIRNCMLYLPEAEKIKVEALPNPWIQKWGPPLLKPYRSINKASDFVFFAFADLRKLKEAHKEYESLAKQLVVCSSDNKLNVSVSQNNDQYFTLIECVVRSVEIAAWNISQKYGINVPQSATAGLKYWDKLQLLQHDTFLSSQLDNSAPVIDRPDESQPPEEGPDESQPTEEGLDKSQPPKRRAGPVPTT